VYLTTLCVYVCVSWFLLKGLILGRGNSRTSGLMRGHKKKPQTVTTCTPPPLLLPPGGGDKTFQFRRKMCFCTVTTSYKKINSRKCSVDKKRSVQQIKKIIWVFTVFLIFNLYIFPDTLVKYEQCCGFGPGIR